MVVSFRHSDDAVLVFAMFIADLISLKAFYKLDLIDLPARLCYNPALLPVEISCLKIHQTTNRSIQTRPYSTVEILHKAEGGSWANSKL